MSVHIAYETPQDVQEQVYEMVKALGKDGRGALKRGANEVTKAAERGTAQMVVMAENVKRKFHSSTLKTKPIWLRLQECQQAPAQLQ